jgi:hypothetical protein
LDRRDNSGSRMDRQRLTPAGPQGWDGRVVGGAVLVEIIVSLHSLSHLTRVVRDLRDAYDIYKVNYLRDIVKITRSRRMI